ncbi:MAG TPA: ABC transporter ATP-binding protein, partial [Streptomyces sp.]|nr:ABC transporter ATP-binding protein [Streptomyces sp.]
LLRPRGERAADTRRRVDAALEAAGFDPGASAKGLRTAVRDLDRLESLRFSVTLALIGRPRLLAVDDTDLKLSAADRAAAWDLLRSVAAAGTTVLAVCSEAPNGAVTVTTTPAAAGEAGAVEADEPAGSAGSTEATEHTEHTDDEEGAADALAETGRA